MSRVEDILAAKITGDEYTKEPLSRVEELLLNLGVSGGSSGGSSGGGTGSGDDVNGYTGSVAQSQILSDADIDDIFMMLSTDND